jgi:hypothetical protein
LTVIGPVSGFRYRFDRPGAKLMVDMGDAISFMTVPNLRRVRDPDELA